MTIADATFHFPVLRLFLRSFFEFKRIDFRVALLIGERRPAAQLVKLLSCLVDAWPTKQVAFKKIYVAHRRALKQRNLSIALLQK